MATVKVSHRTRRGIIRVLRIFHLFQARMMRVAGPRWGDCLITEASASSTRASNGLEKDKLDTAANDVR